MIVANKHVGSSPRVRGTLLDYGEIAEVERFIPACAGNSGWRDVRELHQQVHPRVCGELAAWPSAGEAHGGSSPRVRGTRLLVAANALRFRFIPACAGNSAGHGRVAMNLIGSSPRVRGTHTPYTPLRTCWRFIPACAGNSPDWLHKRGDKTVHPRVCGELAMASAIADTTAGSSPRVRGTLRMSMARFRTLTVHPRVCGELQRAAGADLRDLRFIPACAGNSPRHSALKRLNCGSSPRVRGTRTLARRHRGPVRFIPACAGNSHAASGRGDVYYGSSPRVRGTRAEADRGPAGRRFIPACAGNSAPGCT